MHQYYVLLTLHYPSHSQQMLPPSPLELSYLKMMDQALDQSALDPENSPLLSKTTQPTNKNYSLSSTSFVPGDITSMDSTSQSGLTTNPSNTLIPNHTSQNDKFDGLKPSNSMIILSNTNLALPIKSPMLCLATQVTNSRPYRSEEHTSELQSLRHLVCR